LQLLLCATSIGSILANKSYCFADSEDPEDLEDRDYDQDLGDYSGALSYPHRRSYFGILVATALSFHVTACA
jgi:hypothetical protein